MAPSKKNLMEHYDNDGNLDLSLTGIQEVPVRDIAAIPKAINLDLSCNTIAALPKSFPSSLTHLVKLDLSKNQISSLPENFGLLVHLKHLDLDSNKLESLPLSCGSLKSLRWLDLKNNPLMPKLAQIAGQCLDAKQCQAAAKNVVAALRTMQEQVNAEISRRKEQQMKSLEKAQVEAQPKESQKSKKKKKKNANSTAKSQDSKLTNGQTHLPEAELKGKVENSKNSKASNKGEVKPGLFRKVGRLLKSMIKVTLTCTLLLVFSAYLTSVLNEPLYLSLKNTSVSFIQANVPQKYLQHFDHGLVVAKRATENYSAQVIAISVHLLNKAQEYYVAVSSDQVVQQYLETIKSGWHFLADKASELFLTLKNSLPYYYESFKKIIYESPHHHTT